MSGDQTAPNPINPAAGDRVEWGQGGVTAVGTLVRLSCDEFSAEPEACIHEDGSEHPLWVIRFDDGRVKGRCCQTSIVRRISDAEPPKGSTDAKVIGPRTSSRF